MNDSRLTRNGKAILAYDLEHDPITFERVRDCSDLTDFEPVTHAMMRLTLANRHTVDSNVWQHAGPTHRQSAVGSAVFGGLQQTRCSITNR